MSIKVLPSILYLGCIAMGIGGLVSGAKLLGGSNVTIIETGATFNALATVPISNTTPVIFQKPSGCWAIQNMGHHPCTGMDNDDEGVQSNGACMNPGLCQQWVSGLEVHQIDGSCNTDADCQSKDPIARCDITTRNCACSADFVGHKCLTKDEVCTGDDRSGEWSDADQQCACERWG